MIKVIKDNIDKTPFQQQQEAYGELLDQIGEDGKHGEYSVYWRFGIIYRRKFDNSIVSYIPHETGKVTSVIYDGHDEATSNIIWNTIIGVMSTLDGDVHELNKFVSSNWLNTHKIA